MLHEAAARLNRGPTHVKGMTEGAGIRLTQVGRALVMSERDFRRLQKIAERTDAQARSLAAPA